MKIIDTVLRAIIERVTELEWHSEGLRTRIWVFEYLDSKGNPHSRRVQNWECDDITDDFSSGELEEIYQVVTNHYKCQAHR
jgi:hypothetical protein